MAGTFVNLTETLAEWGLIVGAGGAQLPPMRCPSEEDMLRPLWTPNVVLLTHPSSLTG
jgi:hypothetical protein